MQPAGNAPVVKPKDGGPVLAQWPLQYQQQTLALYAVGKFKPYLKELRTLKGYNLLRDAPYDHLHHHALMYGIKVNGVNFWEETPGCGTQKPIATIPWVESRNAAGDPQFTLQQIINWLAPEDVALQDTAPRALLVEHRTLILTINAARQEVALRWKAAFEVGSKTNQVTLTGANYHGLGMRFLPELDPLAKHLNAGGAPDLNGRQDVSRHSWGSVSFDQPLHPTTLALLGHPSNGRGNAWFFTMRTPFAYLSATQHLDQEPLIYRRGEKFELNYLVTLYSELKSPEPINQRAQEWQTARP